MRPAVIRYNNYKISDLDNYKREKALLFLEFKNELVDILDNKKYIQLYNENQDLIMERHKLYEANINMDLIMSEIEAMCALNENENNGDEEERENTVIYNNPIDNNDDFDVRTHKVKTNISLIGKRNCVSAADYCEIMRTTNLKQRELVLEAIHRIHSERSKFDDKGSMQFF